MDMFVAVRAAAKEGPSTGLFVFIMRAVHGSAHGTQGVVRAGGTAKDATEGTC